MTWRDSFPHKISANRTATKPITPEQLAQSGSEDGEQMALFAWAALSGYKQLEWMHAIPNGGFRNKAEAGRLKATGSRAGVWDIFLPYPVSIYCVPDNIIYNGMYIEMKRSDRRNHKNGGLTDEQIAFGEYVRSVGYQTAICYSWVEAKDAIISYLTP
jgi:hypothetical protein